MNFIKLSKLRKSIRKYSSKPVSRDIIERCVEAARLAPSACNSQPWSFIIVDDKELKNKLADAAFSGIYSMNMFAKQAPVLIVVLTKPSKFSAQIGGFFRGLSYNRIDIGIAAEHLILQATEEGLGTCWLGWLNEKQVKKLLNIPKLKKVDIIISMGYRAETEEKEVKRKSIDEIRTYNMSTGPSVS